VSDFLLTKEKYVFIVKQIITTALNAVCLVEKQQIFPGSTGLGLEPTIYRTGGEYANHQ
jgi:hypothetical protein